MKPAMLLVCLIAAACQHGSDRHGVAVNFVNASHATQCAEEDNIYVQMIGERISQFRVRAEHPRYIGKVRDDSTAPDFTHCDMSADPRFEFEPRTVVLHDDGEIKLVGHTFASFWRPTKTSFRVLDRQEYGLHLVQLIRHVERGEIEQLVVYPADGYWRLKPMPPHALADTAYGSSFLFGPIEEDGRPYVSIREIDFDPVRVAFRLLFADGRIGTLRVMETGSTASVIALAIDPPLADGRPFAALRSMFTSVSNADVAVAEWPGDAGTEARPVLRFDRFRATSARFGRDEPSMHNLSAPDFVFGSFERAPAVAARAAVP
jgi:hypothetical protein